MKIEVNISSTRSRLNKKIRDYTTRIMTLAEQHSVRLRTSSTFLESESEYNIELDLSSKFWDWDQSTSDITTESDQLR